MKNYLHFYNLLRLTTPTKKGGGFLVLHVIINVFIYDFFFTQDDGLLLGFTFAFILTVLISSYYAYIAHTNPDNPIYHFPLTAKQRVFYTYINAIFMFLSLVVGLIIFAYLMVGLFILIGDVNEEITSETYSLAGSLYSIGYMIVFFALYMPLSFIRNIKKRYLYSIFPVLILVIINLTIIYIVEGSFKLSSSIPIIMEDFSKGVILATIVVALSFIGLYISFRKSNNLVKYE